MTARDRLMIIFAATAAVLVAAYMLVVSPERNHASTVAGELSSASARVSAAESKLSEARQAQERYTAAYASIVTLGKAVPTSEEVPSLIYQLAQATHQKKVDFSSIVAGAGAPSAGSAPGAIAAAASAGFTQMPFTFIFNGTYSDLEKLFTAINHDVTRSTAGQIEVNGRLLTIQSVKLGPLPVAGSTSPNSKELSGTITASAYVLPASQGLTAGATEAGPAGAATPAAAGGSSTSTTAPAVARVTP
jgi:hypothetical protein